MNEMTACGRDDWPPLPWLSSETISGARKSVTQRLWYDNNFVGTELDPHLSYAKVAEGCGLKGVSVTING